LTQTSVLLESEIESLGRQILTAGCSVVGWKGENLH